MTTPNSRTPDTNTLRCVLVVGGGGREHALALAAHQHPSAPRVICVPGNGGTAAFAENMQISIGGPQGHAALCELCAAQAVDLVIVGPEAPLVDGLADTLRAAGVAVFGPSAAAAQLEASKAFTKALCDRAGIPTAAYGVFTSKDAALAHLDANPGPIVVKADGLAAGKGVTVADDTAIARAAVSACFAGELGAAGAQVVLEERLNGPEASLFVLTDGTDRIVLPAAQDHKRLGNGDTGPNTGGMGAYAPAPVVTPAIAARALQDIIDPTLADLRARGTPFSGVLYAGLMLTETGPKLIEYNVRFGDPECQVLTLLVGPALIDAMAAIAAGHLAECAGDLQARINAHAADRHALTVVAANAGYPGTVTNGAVITGLDAAGETTGVTVFHAGTKPGIEAGSEQSTGSDMAIVAGGRVLNVTACAADLKSARDAAYTALGKIDWPDAQFRTDIGHQALTS